MKKKLISFIRRNPTYDFFSFENLQPVEKLFVLTISNNKNKNFKLLLHLYKLIGDKKFQEFTLKEVCSSMVYGSLSKAFGSKKLASFWEKEASKVKSRIDLYLLELDKIANKLSEFDIPVIGLKNTGIARGIHDNSAECPMGDIDLLVPQERFKEAHDVFLKMGYVFDDRSPFQIKNFEDAYANGGTEYKCKLIDGSTLWIELQWKAVSGRRILLEQELNVNDLVERSISIKDSKVRLLCPEDNLLQVCLHTAKHSFVRAPGFRLHTDVERIVRAYQIDWETFCCNVEKMNVRNPVFISLFIPAKLFNLNVPDYVLKRLNHTPIKNYFLLKWIKKVGLFSPNKRKWSKVGYIIFNVLLYDNFRDLLKVIFPTQKLLMSQYKYKKSNLFKTYIERIFSLLFKRGNNT